MAVGQANNNGRGKIDFIVSNVRLNRVAHFNVSFVHLIEQSLFIEVTHHFFPNRLFKRFLFFKIIY